MKFNLRKLFNWEIESVSDVYPLAGEMYIFGDPEDMIPIILEYRVDVNYKHHGTHTALFNARPLTANYSVRKLNRASAKAIKYRKNKIQQMKNRAR